MTEQETKQFMLDITKIIVQKTLITGQECMSQEERDKWAERVANLAKDVYYASAEAIFEITGG